MTDSTKEGPQSIIDISTKNIESNLQQDMSVSNGIVLTPMNATDKKEMKEKADMPDLVSIPQSPLNLIKTLPFNLPCQHAQKNLNITWRIYRDYKICIYKPLIPLKLALLLWFGAGSVITPFLAVYFKQRGLALSELSAIYMIAPIVQFIGTTLSGVIADKIGQSKPVLLGNIVITMLIVAGMLMVPRMSTESCEPQSLNLMCDHQESGRLIARTHSEITENIVKPKSCNILCPENLTQLCNEQNFMCEFLADKQEFGNTSFSIHVNGTLRMNDEYFYNVHSLMSKNTTYSRCNGLQRGHCTINCTFLSDVKCAWEIGYRWKFLVTNIVLFVLFLTAYSNCYRILDVTSMSLVKEHNSDFGRERFFSIVGVLIFSPISGYIVDVSTAPGNEKNYASAMYLFIGMLFITLAVVYRLKVHIDPPGKNMCRKSLNLIQNINVISFILVLFVLGTTWNFTKNFTNWFLVELNTPGFLLGLIPAISSLYGLPFLLTTSWWVRNIGPSNLFIIALLAYTGSAIGYSFLYDPWFALPLEITSVFTYHLLWVAVVIHSHDIAPEGLTATVISTAGAIHYSIGKGTGSLIGGLIMDAFGGRIAFRVIAIICLISAVIYGFYLYIRRTCFTIKHDFSNKDVTGSIGCKEVPKEIYTLRNRS